MHFYRICLGAEASERESNRVSLCFHPNDTLLLIAISNELHLWDWSQRKEPFAIIKTGSDLEKILYCRFSPDGAQLVTAISQNEQHQGHVVAPFDSMADAPAEANGGVVPPPEVPPASNSPGIGQSGVSSSPDHTVHGVFISPRESLLLDQDRNYALLNLVARRQQEGANTTTAANGNAPNRVRTDPPTPFVNPYHEAILQVRGAS